MLVQRTSYFYFSQWTTTTTTIWIDHLSECFLLRFIMDIKLKVPISIWRIRVVDPYIGSLFKVAKNIAVPFMKNVLLPVVKDKASQLLKDTAIGKGLKNSLKSSAKRTGKRVINKVFTWRSRRKVIHSKRRNTTKRSIKAKLVTKPKRSQAKQT